MPGRFSYQNITVRSRGYLPHWETEGGTYFITYRERDSLPKHVILRLREERLAIQRGICGAREPNAVERSEIQCRFAFRLDAELDIGVGECRLANIANIVAENLRYHEGSRYDLHAWCVMPNHVHVVATLRETLANVLHSWKSYVAHAVGEPIFGREYFDRLIRDERELEQTIAYVRDNPRKAGLTNWPWVG